jgi:hypothetical protein
MKHVKSPELLQFIDQAIEHYQETIPLLAAWMRRIEDALTDTTDDHEYELSAFGIEQRDIDFIFSLKPIVWLSKHAAEESFQHLYPSILESDDGKLSFTFSKFVDDELKLFSKGEWHCCQSIRCYYYTATGNDVIELARDLAKLQYAGPNVTVYRTCPDGTLEPIGFAGVGKSGHHIWQTY